MQGCSISCPGCLSRDTWPEDDRLLVDVGVITGWVAEVVPKSDGITISGGEPFDQPAAVREIARAARLAATDRAVDAFRPGGGEEGVAGAGSKQQRLQDAAERQRIAQARGVADRAQRRGTEGLDLAVGLDLRHDEDELEVRLLDARRPADDGWRGSTNQEFHALTPLGAQREPATWRADRRLQVTVDERQVWIVGIPRHGDLNRMEAHLAADGIELDQVSWRP